jgi:hypothetical protein
MELIFLPVTHGVGVPIREAGFYPLQGYQKVIYWLVAFG